MPLTHVCIWRNHNWERITAKKASKLYERGVSSHKGLFMCELCNQYVALSSGQNRYFLHSRGEQDKRCKDRSVGANYSDLFSAKVHNLPLKIKILNDHEFEFFLGFFAIPKQLREEKLEQKILIDLGTADKFEYLLSRLQEQTITYLSVGNEPAKEYKIALEQKSSDISVFWPEKTEGIWKEGSLFTANLGEKTGKKLEYDSDVKTETIYYLITKKEYREKYYRTLEIEEICSKHIGWTKWRVYTVKATEYSEEAARFFFELHYRLTDCPVTAYPIWPLHIETPYVVYHQAKEIYMYFQGNAEIKIVSIESVKKRYPYEKPKLLLISSVDGQQLLYIGRISVLKYIFFWKMNLEFPTKEPEISIVDDKDNAVNDGEHNSLPYKNTIIISPAVDGCIDVFERDSIVGKYTLNAGKEFVLDDIQFGQRIVIYQGCDIVWESTFVKKDKERKLEEKEFIKNLKQCSGRKVSVDHSLGSIIENYSDYSELKKWVYQVIREGKISEKALKMLKTRKI
ncbi:MAG: hypothetical protein ACI4HI_03115 [Lachnospiraceae bacterium]